MRQLEVEQALSDENCKFRFLEKGERPREDAYMALGRTHAGRYLFIVFIHKLNSDALILSARDMKRKERRRYENK